MTKTQVRPLLAAHKTCGIVFAEEGVHSLSAMAHSAPAHLWRRRLGWLAAFTALGLAALWAGMEWLVHEARSRVNARLEERGLVLTAEQEVWSLFGGVTLKKAVLARREPGQPPVLEVSALHVDVHWAESWAEKKPVTQWLAEEATLTFHDEAGGVTLNKVSLDLTTRSGAVQVARLQAWQGALEIHLTGELHTRRDNAAPHTPLVPQLKPLRTVLNTLRFEEGTGPFRVTGHFSMDLQQKPAQWMAELEGAGTQVQWRGVPLEKARVAGTASSAGLDLQGTFKLQTAAVQMHLSREGWEQTALNMEGTMADPNGAASTFQADFLGSSRTLTVKEAKGRANPLQMLESVPALAPSLPRGIVIKSFPEYRLENLKWQSGPDAKPWTLETFALLAPADLEVQVRDSPLAVTQVTGSFSRQGNGWHLNQLKGHLLGGNVQLNGIYDGHILREAKVGFSHLRLARLSPWLGQVSDKLADSDLTLSYQGSVCRDPVRSTGRGSLAITNAPVVHIPLLEQTYALFPKVLPNRGRDGTGEFQVSFVMSKGVATVDPFKGRSQSVTITAKGTVNLVKKYVKGHARANLRGVVGRITLPLSHVLTDMKIQGPLDDIRVTPDGPIGAAGNALKGGAKISTGLLKEGLSVPFEAMGLFRD